MACAGAVAEPRAHKVAVGRFCSRGEEIFHKARPLIHEAGAGGNAPTATCACASSVRRARRGTAQKQLWVKTAGSSARAPTSTWSVASSRPSPRRRREPAMCALPARRTAHAAVPRRAPRAVAGCSWRTGTPSTRRQRSSTWHTQPMCAQPPGPARGVPDACRPPQLCRARRHGTWSSTGTAMASSY